MRRALAMLKYLPAVLCGLLVVAWAASAFVSLCLMWPWHSHDDHGGFFISIDYGSLVATHDPEVKLPFEFTTFKAGSGFIKASTLLGTFDFLDGPWGITEYSIPIPMILTVSLVPAWGCFNHFRFPLWSCFAYTALIAAELAYYLQ
jgi:hypothetical protein